MSGFMRKPYFYICKNFNLIPSVTTVGFKLELVKMTKDSFSHDMAHIFSEY